MQKVASPFLMNVGVDANTTSGKPTRIMWGSIVLRLLLCICISLIVTLSYAYFFNRHYQVQTRVFASHGNPGSSGEENEKNSAMADQEVNARREVLRSRSSLLNIVQKLNLSVRYRKVGLLRDEEIYLKSPMRFELIRAGDLSSKRLNVKINSPHSFLLDTAGAKPQEYTFNTMYTDKMGTWRIVNMPNLKDYLGAQFYISVEDPARTADNLLSNLDVSISGSPARKIDLSLEETEVLRAIDILQELCAAYLQSNQVQQEKLAQLELRFITERMGQLESDLADVDKRISGMRQDGVNTEFSAAVSSYLDQVKANDRQLIEADLQLSRLLQLQSILSKPGLSRTSIASLAAPAPSLNFALMHLQQLEDEYESLTKTHLQQDPEVSMVSQQIKDSQQEIQSELQQLLKPVEVLSSKIKSANSVLESGIRNAPATEKAMAALIREKTNLQQLYLSLMQKKEESSMGHAAYLAFSKPQTGNFQMSQTWPLNYSVALLGFGVPAVILFLQGLFGQGFRRKT
jgi:hypothetical protein